MEIQNSSNWHYHIVTQSEIRANFFLLDFNNKEFGYSQSADT